LVEQRIENPRVGGSIPPLATKLLHPGNLKDIPGSLKALENKNSRAFLCPQNVQLKTRLEIQGIQ
jgi:hypothetical protein